jgi:hypothetical protein
MRIKIENVIWQFAKAFRKKFVADHPGLAKAPLFVDWFAPLQGRRWIDIGCGTRQLSSQIVGKRKFEPSHRG